MLLRWRAPIEIGQPGAFVQLPLSAEVYAHSLQRDLADLRVIDARGERVPFALLAAPLSAANEPVPAARELETATRFYPLPPLPGDARAESIELNVVNGRVSVRTPGSGASTARPTSGAAAISPGWLIDLGDSTEPSPRAYALRLTWSGPVEFSAGFSLASSTDLRSWRNAASGQVMALASSDGVLTQPLVSLPSGVGRYVRLVWDEVSSAPRLTGAQALRREQVAAAGAPDATTEIIVAPLPRDAARTDAPAALEFDLGGVLPAQQIDLDLGVGTRVAPVRLQMRATADQPWQSLGGAVFYRIERGDTVDRAPALPMTVALRYLRVQPDERAGALDADALRLHVRAQLGSLVFASQGQAPYELHVGSVQASAGALPLRTLVPTLDQERARFGQASLGQWGEVSEAVRREQADARRAQWRPRLLWGVLIAGVLLLGALVWRLARTVSR
jgi:hypothetical protein